MGKRRQQQEHIPSLKYSEEGGERLGKVRRRKVYKEGRCRRGWEHPHKSHSGEKLGRRCVSTQKKRKTSLEVMQRRDVIMAIGKYISLKPDVHFASQRTQLCLAWWKTHPLMFQLNKQQQCRRKMLQREAAVLGYTVSSNPTHTVLSANISHLNGERLFGEELHIGPTALNPPIEY